MGAEIGLLAVRRSIFIGAEPDRVWKEFETFEALRSWFGTRSAAGEGQELLEYEPRVGGKVRLDCGTADAPRHFGGTITVFEPGRELSWDNDWIPSDAPVPNMITIRLTRMSGGTVVELFHHAFERVGRVGAEQHRGYEGGWNMRQLEALRELVAA